MSLIQAQCRAGVSPKIKIRVFLIILISVPPVLTQVLLQPSGRYVTTPGANVDFTCVISPCGGTLVGIQWLVNDTLLEDTNLTNVNAHFTSIGCGIGILKFTNIPLEYNVTNVTCRRISTSNTNVLLLQGHLSAVSSLTLTAQNSTIFLNWTAPFTLNITGVDPDITYCVDVVNSTSSSTLHSECGINVTEFSYPLPPKSWCNTMYNFSVTPVNLVGNGMQAAQQLNEESSVAVSVSSSVSTADTSGIITYFLITMSAPVCNGELTFMDLNTGDRSLTLRDTDLAIAENNITFTTEQLTVHHNYNVTVRASNVAGSAMSYITISTHDVMTVSVVERKGIEVTTVYFKYSDAQGALFNFVFICDDGAVDFSRSVLLALDRNTSHNYTLPFELFPGQYRILVYDIEHDGTLSDGVGYPAVVITELLMTENNKSSSFQPMFYNFNSCHVYAFLGLILAKCNYTSTSTASGFQMIAQLNDFNRVHKLYINQTQNRQTLATVLVEESGTYQVTIFAIRNETGIVNSNVEYQSINQVIVNVIPPRVTESATITSETVNPGTCQEIISLKIGAGIGSGVLLCIVIFLCGIIIAQYSKIKQMSISTNKSLIQMDLPMEELNPTNDEIQLYEEIRATNDGASSSVPVSVTTATTCPQYEDIVPAGLATPKSGDDYQITLCAAYGVPLN